jgi:ATP-dependent Clp protease, protease subunit
VKSLSKFWNFIKNEASPDDVELRIEGEIVADDDAWLYEWFEMAHASPNKFREELKTHAGKQITVWIDSWGGDTTAAAGIYNALKEHKGGVIVKIDGKAVSAGSVIAMAGEEVQISPAGLIMIHNPYTWAIGESKDMKHMADVLDEVKESIVNVYQTKTGKSRKKISEMLDNETWMSAKTAVKEGFADKIMYVEAGKEAEGIENSFTLNRLAIQNSANKNMRHFIEQYSKLKKPQDKPPEEPRQVPVDLYTKYENIIERRSRL